MLCRVVQQDDFQTLKSSNLYMADVPETSTTLLKTLARDSQNVRWSEFVVRYRPMMEAFMRERFPSVDSDDAIQEVLVALCRVLPGYRYAPDEKGRFRSYLTGILRNKAMRILRRQKRDDEMLADYVADGAANGRDGSPSCPQCQVDAVVDDQSYRESLFEIALQEFLSCESVADRTKRIFERTALNGESPEDVAESFNMTRHAVDQAKSRAMARLRELVKKLEDIANG